MQNSIIEQDGGQSLGQESANEQNNSSYYEQHEKSPFAVASGEDGYMVTWGNYVVAIGYETTEQAYEAIENRDYAVLAGLISIMTEQIIKLKNQ